MDHRIKPNPYPLPVIIGVGVLLNFVLGLIFIELQLPLYLDAIGTVTFTLLGGCRVGALIGLFSTLAGSLLNPHLAFFFFTQFTIAVVVGIAAQNGGFKNIPRVVLTGIILGFIAALVSAPAVALAFGGTSPFVIATGECLRRAFFSAEAWTEPLDKTCQCLAAVALVRSLPKAQRARLSTPANFLAANNLE